MSCRKILSKLQKGHFHVRKKTDFGDERIKGQIKPVQARIAILDRIVKKALELTLSSCRHAKSSIWLTGRRLMTGFDMVFTLDSTISAPYCMRYSDVFTTKKTRRCTFTTLEEAFPCSYTRIAVPTRGKDDIRETKSDPTAEDAEDCWAPSFSPLLPLLDGD